MSGITEYPLAFLDSLACTNSSTERRADGCRASVQDTTSYDFPFRRQCRNRPRGGGGLCLLHAAHQSAGLTVVEYEADHSREAVPDDDLQSHLTDEALARRVLEATYAEDDGGEATLGELQACRRRLAQCRRRGDTLRYYAGGVGAAMGMMAGGTLASNNADELSMYYA